MTVEALDSAAPLHVFDDHSSRATITNLNKQYEHDMTLTKPNADNPGCEIASGVILGALL